MGISLSELVLPSDADKYVVENSTEHLTEDVIAWVNSVTPLWKLVRLRYEWEELIKKSQGHSMFLELTYSPEKTGLEFPCAEFYFYPIRYWTVYFVDFVEYSKVKVIIRMVKK